MKNVFVITNGNVLNNLDDNKSATFTRIHYLLNELNEFQDINVSSIQFKQLPRTSSTNIIFNNIVKSIVALKSTVFLIINRPIVFFAYPHSLNTIQNRILFNASKLLNLKIIMDVHDTIEQVNVLGNGKSKLNSKIEKDCIVKSSLLLILNKSMWNSIRNLYNINEEKKVIFIPNAFEKSFLELYPNSYKCVENRLNICYMGGLTKNRGIDILVQACIELHEKYSCLKLFLFGSYGVGISEELKYIIESSDFIIRKEIPRKDIAKSLQTMDLFVMPYNPDIKYMNESSPTKFYEYIGCAKPIICTKCESLTNVGKNNSILYVDYNVEDFKRMMEFLIQNPRIREEMSKKMTEIRLDHTWKGRANDLHNAIIALTNNSNES
ncbi:glycosyltransferase [Methanococcoides sp. NM1]|uniref:glycosyltransferase n=1 Tax=Methanococcoides sp. NM1 TaxID=1201013 RepID=UPI0010837888|nr:glycosyltransferase [Methanococcoides sp. NM1]